MEKKVYAKSEIKEKNARENKNNKDNVITEIQNIEHLIQVKDRFRKGRNLSFLKGREEKKKETDYREKKRKRREKRKKSVDFRYRNRVVSISNQARRTSKQRAESKRKKYEKIC